MNIKEILLEKNYSDEKEKKKYYNLFLKNWCKNIVDIWCWEWKFIEINNKSIIWLDQSKESIEICKLKWLNCIQGDALNTPFKNNEFDGVYCSHLIEHLYYNDALRLLNELDRILKKWGILIIASPLFNRNFYDDISHIKPYTPESIIRHTCILKNWQKTAWNTKWYYKSISINYRYWLFLNLFEIKYLSFVFSRISQFLYLIWIKNYFSRTWYWLILKKI